MVCRVVRYTAAAACAVGVVPSTLWAGTVPPPEVELIPFATGVARCSDIYPVPGSPGHYFIAEQRVGSSSTARVRLWDRTNDTSTIFAELPTISTQGPQGLLAMTVDPDYVSNGMIYVNYTDFAGSSRIARYQRSAADPTVADPSSFEIMLTIPQLGPTHNAAWLDFGPDGYLYIGTGDGGNGGDVNNNAQNLSNGRLLGKLLRIDPHGGVPGVTFYGIPADNPFAGTANDEEIWAYGFRHPWRCAFDSLTNDLYIADVGDATWEEINFQPASSTGGENYGWHCREGEFPSHPDDCVPGTAFVEPIYTYPHVATGEPFRCSVIGGEVYRGSAIPELQGYFFFADYCSNEVKAIRHHDGVTDLMDLTAQLAGCDIDLTTITGFGLDEDGEMLILARGSGNIYKVVPVCGPDLNHDGVVDFKDLNEALEYWGETDVSDDADGDCDIDFDDLNILLEAWGTPCS
ncbi:MAG: PQQ-dependent sugar dehydrogenase [Phycisphaerales bacterium]|nr:PQQ-dependent sugar dehydrogenase [Phycisphaerales bacterium]